MTLMTEKQEKQILMISFCSGLLFAIAEFIFAIYSRSQSALTDAMYDLSELVFIALLIFLTPLFHKPVSEKHPYGYFQVESVFVIIKGIMVLSVTMGVSAGVIESVLSGGSRVDHDLVAEFQCILGAASLVIYLGMKRLSRDLSSPTIDAELLGWRLDIAYSMGMAAAFFSSRFLERTPLSPIVPYVDQIIAVGERGRFVRGFPLFREKAGQKAFHTARASARAKFFKHRAGFAPSGRCATGCNGWVPEPSPSSPPAMPPLPRGRGFGRGGKFIGYRLTGAGR